MSGPEVKTDSDHPAHAGIFKTLDLLRLYEKDGSPVFFIVQGLSSSGDHESPPDNSYMYDSHTCPTNYIRIEAVFTPDDDDPHGVFEYVRSVWYPKALEDAGVNDVDGMLRALFPETFGVTEIEGEVNAAAPDTQSQLPAR